MQLIQYFKGLHYNLRAYILAAMIIASLFTVSYMRLTIQSDQLFLIRLQQVYGLLAVVLLYAAVILTPLSKIFADKIWLNKALFARRAIGVSAAYFTILHTAIAVIDQVGGLANLALLPSRFKVAFVLGGIATVILMLMAVTSFDYAMKKMTFKRWKQLHQFVYLAGVLIIIHVWLIGTHADITGIRVATAAALAVLFALESNRLIAKYLTRTTVFKKAMAGMALFAVLFGSLFLLPVFAGNYHSEHSDDAGSYTSTQEGVN